MVAWAKAQGKGPADFVVLSKLIEKGLAPETVFPMGHASKQPGISLAMVRTQYDICQFLCGFAPFDPAHDFYIHAGLMNGIRKTALALFSDRNLGPLPVDAPRVVGSICESQAVGVALYPHVIFATPSCVPNVAMEAGLFRKDEKEAEHLVIQLRAVRDIGLGSPFTFCFADRGMMDHRVRAKMNNDRRIYCQCDLCKAQLEMPAERQLNVMQDALIAAYTKTTVPRPVDLKTTVPRSSIVAVREEPVDLKTTIPAL